MDPEIKVERLIFPTKYVIPKSLKGYHFTIGQVSSRFITSNRFIVR